MVKRAYSLELKENISAETAHKNSLSGILKNNRAFVCSDKECNIKLTCTKWSDKSAKRIFFTPSSKNDLHIAGCNESGEDEEKHRSKFEKENAKTTIAKNGVIVLKKISEQKTVKQESKYIKDAITIPTISNKSSNDFNRVKPEGSYITSILSLIDMYKDTDLNNKNKILKISSTENLTLEEFFFNIDTTSPIPTNKTRIYYGKVKVSTFKETGLKISFINSHISQPLFTNKKRMFDKYYGKYAKEHVDKDAEIYVFFRGYLNEKNKWCSFNNEFYKDLYFSKTNILY
ncbi:hypothetical protein [Bacillus sp. B4EP4a]|uniref:hypothetical protein n=1 Tax=Bacillus sp. B4EP4a TaxID=2590665 RepID=UPI001153180A|nr:hypothetical protein [Bacillus sp. B4EP4a]